MKTNKGFRQHARFAVSWSVSYWNDGVFFGQGTTLDISHVACQLAGTMPVAVGMVLKARIAPPQREEALYVHEARVLWAEGCKFGLELRGLSTKDYRWLMKFLENAERRNSFRQAGEAPTLEDLAAVPLVMPLNE